MSQDETNMLSELKIAVPSDDGTKYYTIPLLDSSYATKEEALEGISDNKVISPSTLDYKLDNTVASTSKYGLTKLNNSVTSTSTVLAATANSVKTAYDRGSLGVTNAATAQTTANGKWTAVDASTTVKGIVQLNNSVTSTSTTLAAAANSVKTAYDRGSLGVTNAATAQTTANGKWTAVNASTTAKGIVELATSAETATGTDATRAITPAGLLGRTATTSRAGLIEIATQAEVDAGTATNKAVCPAYLKNTAIVGEYCCLINGSSTGAPNEIQSSALGSSGTITKSTRYVLTNPFGNSVPVIVKAEIYANGMWGYSGWMFGSTAYGVIASYVQGKGIIIQTGGGGLATHSHQQGNPFNTSDAATSAKCRVHVWKVGV